MSVYTHNTFESIRLDNVRRVSNSSSLAPRNTIFIFLHEVLLNYPCACCHAPTLSQAWDNRRVNPSGVINTFLELAQGFQTPVHTYNSPITGEYITKLKKNTKGYVYIYQRFNRLQTYNPTDPFYAKESLIQHAITKEFMYTICLKRKVHTKLQRNTSSRPAHRKATRTTQPEERKRESDE